MTRFNIDAFPPALSGLGASIYKPGQEVPKSGLYKVVHDPNHTTQEHEVTCVIGERFPPCNHCGNHPRFELVRAAHHISTHEHFRK